MILMREAGQVSCGLLGLWAVITMFFQFYVLTISIRERRSALYTGMAVLNTIFNYAVFQYANIYGRGYLNEFEFRMGKMPVLGVVAMLGISLLLSMLMYFDVEYWEEHHVSARAVKKALDILPTGLCYSWENGFPKLVNLSMENLSRRLWGSPVDDGNELWRMLAGREPAREAEHLGTEKKPMVRFPEGDVYQFSRNMRSFEGIPLTEVIATDITEEYELGRKLAAENEKVEQINARLREFSADVTDATIQREILSAKVRIHDNLGNLLLTTRRYVQEGEETDREELTVMWRQIMTLLRRDDRAEATDMYHTVMQAAEDVGVGVWVRGVLPEVSWQKRIVAAAINECITNTLRHAGGDELRIHVKNDEKRTAVIFTNNGRIPEKPIRETGGLGNLRRMTEAQGAEMRVESAPEFRLTLLFGKEEERHGIQRSDS